MAPPTLYKSGVKPIHFLYDFQRFKEYKDLCHKEGITHSEDLRKYVDDRLERNAIAEGDIPGENISCLGYTPKPAQQKITDTLENIENLQGIPILSSNEKIHEYLKSIDLQTANELNRRLRVWKTQVANTVEDLRRALIVQNIGARVK
jgi:hypothetical protein